MHLRYAQAWRIRPLQIQIIRKLYLFFFGGKIEPSGWLSTEVIAFKILQSCLYKRSLMETGKETKWRLWQRCKKCGMIFKSGSDAPYTERQYVKFGRTKDLNKWSIST